MTVDAGPALPDDWDRLVTLTRQLRAVEAGAIVDSDNPAIRRINARRRLEQRMRERREAEARRGLAQLEERTAAIVANAPVVAPAWTPKRGGWLDPYVVPGPFWSPTPVLGFRRWDIRDDCLMGAFRPWPEPTYVAGCVRRRDELMGGDIPHTDGSCGRPPCGIYATKEPTMVVWGTWEESRPIAYGVVALSGKVVEHEFGYRAARATALAMLVKSGDRLIGVFGADLSRLFRYPGATITRLGAGTSSRPVGTLSRHEYHNGLVDDLGRLRSAHRTSLNGGAVP